MGSSFTTRLSVAPLPKHPATHTAWYDECLLEAIYWTARCAAILPLLYTQFAAVSYWYANELETAPTTNTMPPELEAAVIP